MTDTARIADDRFHAALGHVIGVVRTSLVISRADLAHRAHISEESLVAIERGEAEPSPDVLRAIADALGLTTNGLIESTYRHLAKQESTTPPPPIPIVKMSADPPADRWPPELAVAEAADGAAESAPASPEDDPEPDIPVLTIPSTSDDSESLAAPEAVEPPTVPEVEDAPAPAATDAEDDPPVGPPEVEAARPPTAEVAAPEPEDDTEPELVAVEPRPAPDRSGPAADLFGALMADLADDLDEADRRLVLDLVLRLTAH